MFSQTINGVLRDWMTEIKIENLFVCLHSCRLAFYSYNRNSLSYRFSAIIPFLTPYTNGSTIWHWLRVIPLQGVLFHTYKMVSFLHLNIILSILQNTKFNFLRNVELIDPLLWFEIRPLLLHRSSVVSQVLVPFDFIVVRDFVVRFYS